MIKTQNLFLILSNYWFSFALYKGTQLLHLKNLPLDMYFNSSLYCSKKLTWHWFFFFNLRSKVTWFYTNSKYFLVLDYVFACIRTFFLIVMIIIACPVLTLLMFNWQQVLQLSDLKASMIVKGCVSSGHLKHYNFTVYENISSQGISVIHIRLINCTPVDRDKWSCPAICEPKHSLMVPNLVKLFYINIT